MLKDYGLVTVLMSVYKTDSALLERSVTSILKQTYTNIEFIIVNDGADRDCMDYLQNLADDRIIIVENECNLGLAASLNKGIELAKGKYIARMDADDYSLPERIEEQVSYMEGHSDVDVLACIAMDIQYEKLTGGIGGAYKKFDNEDMKIELSLAPKTYPHPAVMFRTDFLRRTGLRYDEEFKRAQDYDMWARCSIEGKLDSLQKTLLLYDKGDATTDDPSELQVYYSNQTKLKCLKRLLPDASTEEKDLYVHMRDMGMSGNVSDNLELVKKLIEANKVLGIYDPHKYSSILHFWWGRKMLYKENRAFLAEFLKHPGFILRVVAAYFERFPAHLSQQKYTRDYAGKVLSEGIGQFGI